MPVYSLQHFRSHISACFASRWGLFVCLSVCRSSTVSGRQVTLAIVRSTQVEQGHVIITLTVHRASALQSSCLCIFPPLSLSLQVKLQAAVYRPTCQPLDRGAYENRRRVGGIQAVLHAAPRRCHGHWKSIARSSGAGCRHFSSRYPCECVCVCVGSRAACWGHGDRCPCTVLHSLSAVDNTAVPCSAVAWRCICRWPAALLSIAGRLVWVENVITGISSYRELCRYEETASIKRLSNSSAITRLFDRPHTTYS